MSALGVSGYFAVAVAGVEMELKKLKCIKVQNHHVGPVHTGKFGMVPNEICFNLSNPSVHTGNRLKKKNLGDI